MNSSKVVRFIKIVTRDGDKPFRTVRVMEELGCGRRTVQRIREDLEKNFRVRFTYTKDVGWEVRDWGWFNIRRINAEDFFESKKANENGKA